MWLKEFRREPTRLASLLFWDTMLTPSVVLQKDGSLLATLQVRGPDLEASLDVELVAQAAKLNNFVKRFESGWALMTEVRRREATQYPAATWPDPVSAAIDAERRHWFMASPAAHYDNDIYLTLIYKMAQQAGHSWRDWLYEHLPQGQDAEAYAVTYFEEECQRALGLLKTCCADVRLLEGNALLTYLHSTVSTKHHPVQVPDPACYLDTYLTDMDMHSGIYPRLGDAYLRCLSIRGYPESTAPGILDPLTHLPLELRACLRYIPLDRADAVAVIRQYAKRWYGKRKDAGTAMAERASKQQSAVVDIAALENFQGAMEAQASVQHGRVSFGYLTQTVVLWDPDIGKLDLKVKAVEQALNGAGFVAKVEDLNAMDAWNGTIPGNVYSNARRPLLHSLNLAHLFPATSPWRGQPWNAHLQGPAVIQATGRGHTPVGLSLHQNDVGHFGLIGSTGDGKSTWLNFLCAQWRRYPGAEVAIFDKEYAARKLTAAVGGRWYDLGTTPLQPLARLHLPYEIAWAVDWLDALLTQERVMVTPDIKEDLFTALMALAKEESSRRTMSQLVQRLTHTVAQQALRMYTQEGPYGLVLDADEDGIGEAPWLCFEMTAILETPRILGAMLPALFHRLEQRLTGVPVLYVLHEGWVAFDTPFWATRLRAWLKGLRVRNGSVGVATQSLADAVNSPIMPALLDNIATWICTPNAAALTQEIGKYYQAIGLNERQREQLTRGTKKRDYYVKQESGASMLQLNLGPKALAFCGTPDPAALRQITTMIDEDPATFAARYLQEQGLGL